MWVVTDDGKQLWETQGQPKTDNKLRANKQKLFPNSQVLLSRSPKRPKGMVTWVTETFHLSPASQLSIPQEYSFLHHQQQPDNIPR